MTLEEAARFFSTPSPAIERAQAAFAASDARMRAITLPLERAIARSDHALTHLKETE